MSQKITAQVGPTITLEEAVPGALNGKEDHLVSLNANGKAVRYDGTAPAVGVYVSRLALDSTAIEVRPINATGTARLVQSAAITPGKQVVPDAATARVKLGASGNAAIGIKLAPANAGAAGDVIEVVLIPGPVA